MASNTTTLLTHFGGPMNDVTTVLMGVGGSIWILSLLLGIVELATVRTIRAPRRRTFTQIQLANTQYQTIIVPAAAALISGLFVSMAASFYHDSFVSSEESWQSSAGTITFLVGVIVLLIAIRRLFTGVGEPVELASDPFTIRAAADESALYPRQASLDPTVLTKRLGDWAQHLSAHSMNLSTKATSAHLDHSLTRAAGTRGLWRSIPRSLQVYCAAMLRFPVRFGWPLLGFILWNVGAVWFAAGSPSLHLTGSWRPWGALGLSVLVSAAPTAFYCAARGNRACLWHRVNLSALADAQAAIAEAAAAHASVAAEAAMLRRVLARADAFLEGEAAASHRGARDLIRLGRLRVSVSTDPR